MKTDQLEKKLLAKKRESSMERVIDDKAEKERKELKQKVILVLVRVMTVTFFVFAIYVVFKPVTEFLLMCENYIRFYILNYFFK